MDQIFDFIAKYISESFRVSLDRIKPESRLAHDLKIYGQDAIDLLEMVAQKYEVDMSKFNFDEYFPGDGGLNLAFHIKHFRDKRYKPLTISDLIRAIENRKLWP